MKNVKIACTIALCLLVSVAFAQRNLDSNAEKPIKVKNEETTTLTVEKEASFGYHHNNYKQHVKAKKARKWFRSKGHVHRTAKATNYKMPFTEEKQVEKIVVEESETPKRSRNYKRPYSSN